MAPVHSSDDAVRTSSQADGTEGDSPNRRHLRLQRARTPLGRLLRYAGLLLGAFIGWSLGGALAARPELIAVSQFFLAATLAALGFLATPYIVFDLVDALLKRLRGLAFETLLVTTLGAFTGAALGLLLAWPMTLLPRPAGTIGPALVAVLTTLLGAVAAHSKQDELLRLFPGRLRLREQDWLVLDTSVLIDGRIQPLLRLGWLEGTVVIPAEVIRELHRLSEHPEPHRRIRGRRGLELLRRLREEHGASCIVVPEFEPARETDEAVLLRCLELGGRLLTCDQRLAEVAKIRDLRVLNPHQLAEALRSPIHAGDRFSLRLVGPGREPNQAIGYLDDGTLVVVEQGAALIGQEVLIEVTRTLQTAGGRLVFGQLVSDRVP